MNFPDMLCTAFLIKSGIADAVWNSGWREPLVTNLHRNADASKATGNITLPKNAVIIGYVEHANSIINDLPSDGKYILILREGDGNLNITNIPSSVRQIYAVNVTQSHPLVTPMPMAFHHGGDDEGEMCFKLNDIKNSISRDKQNTVLATFSIEGYKNNPQHERLSCLNYFKDKNWATMPNQLKNKEWVTSPIYCTDYRKMLRYHDYLAAPIGCAYERIAYWEAMFLGAIPICLRHPALLHFEDMPIAFVNKWEDVTEEWCYNNLGIIQKNMDKITLSYWLDKINEMKKI